MVSVPLQTGPSPMAPGYGPTNGAVLDDAALSHLAASAHGLLVFSGLPATPPVRELVALLEALAGGNAAGWLAAFGALYRACLAATDRAAWTEVASTGMPGGSADALTAALLDALLLDENALSWGEWPAEALRPAVAQDLATLQALAAAGRELPHVLAERRGRAGGRHSGASLRVPVMITEWPRVPAAGDGAPVASAAHHDGISGTAVSQDGVALRRRFLAAGQWADVADDLARYFARHGGGPFAHFRAFRWEGPEGGMAPVTQPDVVPAALLVGYEAERALLRRNTAQFVAGHPANNVLLYGDRGTGKSSSVKALLAERGEGWDRLRLVEVPKARLGDFPRIVAQLRGRPQRFVLFVDDLSFEDGETQYKDMKAMLEGGLEARPENVVVYATSNRRHLVREQHADRARPGSEEVHAWDSVQEKLSFADRFGMTITFPTPDQRQFLAIVDGLAQQRGLTVEPAALHARAIEWAAWHNGRSARTARQFVDALAGELALGADRGTHRGDGGGAAG